MPADLQRRVRAYYEFVWLCMHGDKDQRSYLQELPHALRADILSFVYGPLLRRNSLFAHTRADVIAMVAQRLSSQL